MDDILASRDIGVEKKGCAFCNNGPTIHFNEHYVFCTECAAIYTIMTVEQGCEHLASGKNAIFVVHAPWFKVLREGITHVTDNNRCSVCSDKIIDGGW